MQHLLIEMENRIRTLDADTRSPVTQQATCAVFRDVLIPLLQGEIKAAGIFGFVARAVLGKLVGLLKSYVSRNCPIAVELQARPQGFAP